jgi:hypothetical protein
VKTRIGWYVRRLRNMSPAEILHRLGERARRALMRRRPIAWRELPPAPLPVLPGLADRVRAADGATRAALADAAAAILAGRFSALGQHWPQRPTDALVSPDLWRFSPDTGRHWPDAGTFCFDIDLRDTATVGDIKYAWEMNRLQWLQPLAAQSLLTADSTALATIEAAITSWHAANPPYGGIAWTSGIEIALRAISLLVVTSLVGDRLRPETIIRIRQVLQASDDWLAQFPSLHSSANNHLMAERVGRYLIAAGTASPTAPRRAADVETEILRQILPDGVGAEQTPTYSAFTAELALISAFVARDGGAPFSAEAITRLDRFSRFIGWLARSDGTVPAIGDDDEGRALSWCAPEPAYAVSVAASIATLTGSAPPAAAAPSMRALLLGTPAAPPATSEGTMSLADGGYTVWRRRHAGRDLHLVVDHGPLGYLAIAAHGHADALAFTLDLDGRPVLVDPGTYLYQSGGAWRDWFRGTRAHNTLAVAGADQSTIAGPFNWSHKAQARLIESTDTRIAASHDGYRTRFGVDHDRRITLVENGIEIADSLVGAGAPRRVELTLQLAPGLAIDHEGPTVTVTDPATGATVLVIRFPDESVTHATGGDRPDGGWVSPAFGRRVPATRLTWTGLLGREPVRTILAFRS